MTPYINEDHPEPAYHCGRLMSVLASIQEEALGKVNAGVIQRFYAAASTTPALVLGRLTRTSQFHLDKISGDKPGLAFWYKGKIANICVCLKDTIPTTLTLAEQSLFALGYYQQMALDRAKNPDNENNEEDADAGAN